MAAVLWHNGMFVMFNNVFKMNRLCRRNMLIQDKDVMCPDVNMALRK